MHLSPQTRAKVELYKRGDFSALELSPKQEMAFSLMHPSNKECRVLTYGGGAGGGKSWVIALDCIMKSLAYDGISGYIARNELKRLMNSTYITFLKVCKTLDLKESVHWKLDGKYNVIKFNNGSTIALLDVSYQPRDPLYERFGSTVYTYGYNEEAGEIDFDAYDILRLRTGRHLNKEYDFYPKNCNTANPKKNWLYNLFYNPWTKGALKKGHYFIQALVTDNPKIDPEYIKSLEDTDDVVKRERLLLGNWDYDNDPAKLINFDRIQDLYTNSHVCSGEMYISADIAFEGSDLFVIGVWSGFRLVKVNTIDKSNGKQVVKALEELKNEYSVPNSNIVFDADGGGNGISGWILNANEFHNGSSAKMGENYNNLKSQCYFKLAKMINDAKIWIQDDRFKETIDQELAQVKKDKVDDDTKLQIVPKKKVKDALGGRSPDFSDMLMMRMYFEVQGKVETFNPSFF